MTTEELLATFEDIARNSVRLKESIIATAQSQGVPLSTFTEVFEELDRRREQCEACAAAIRRGDAVSIHDLNV
ncbi:hypothetical protein GCM10022239_03740 [Leifsonia bigeumensis]|uniref:Uncharacterized protein n=1 Tax=Leifsonella bigeumensis TaxID=433643 RepID=A0ABP7F385_9MICO